MNFISFAIFFIGCALGQGYDPELYKGYRVIGVTPQTDEQVKQLRDISLNEVKLDFWAGAHRPKDEANILVPPHKYKNMFKKLKDLGMEQRIIFDDVERLLYKEKMHLLGRMKLSTEFDYDEFHTYEEIIAETDVLASKCRGDLGIKCETYILGKSFEGREQKVLRVYIDKPNRRAYWMDSMVHAREWLAVATNMNIAKHLITNYDSSEEVRRLMDDGDWYFLFLHNPDGYAYTWTDERFWRKNRFPNSEKVPGTECKGVDLNRNYDYRWGSVGTSDDPCSEVYKGEAPADQAEVFNVQNEILRLAPRLKAFVTLHTAARIILSPWGTIAEGNATEYVCEFLEEYESVHVDGVAKLMAKKIQEHFNHSTWTGGNACDTFSPAAGLAQDYARGVGMIRYSFTPELRNRDENNTYFGLLPPPEQIYFSFMEMWTGFVTMVDSINAGESNFNCENHNGSTGGGGTVTKLFCWWLFIPLYFLSGWPLV